MDALETGAPSISILDQGLWLLVVLRSVLTQEYSLLYAVMLWMMCLLMLSAGGSVIIIVSYFCCDKCCVACIYSFFFHSTCVCVVWLWSLLYSYPPSLSISLSRLSHLFPTDPVFEVLIGNLSDYSIYNSTYVITNISCSYNYLSSCSYTTSSTDCTGYGGVAIFSCRRSMIIDNNILNV